MLYLYLVYMLYIFSLYQIPGLICFDKVKLKIKNMKQNKLEIIHKIIYRLLGFLSSIVEHC